MSFKVRTFPYPVLAEFNDDYVSPAKFIARANFSVHDENGRSKPVLRYEFELVSETLQSLVEAKKAEVVVELDCRETLYRKLIHISESSGEVPLEAGELIGGVDVTFFVISLTDIDDFKPESINEEYGGQTFSILDGDPLAIALADSSELGFNWKSKPDMLKVLLAKDLDPYAYSFDCTSSPIIIRVGERYLDYWQRTRGDISTKPHLYQGLYKDCMVAALTTLKDDPENDTPWARALVERIEKLGNSVDPNWEFADINELALKIVAKQGIEKLVEQNNAY